MNLQIIQDRYGGKTGIFIPMKDWETIIDKHKDLKILMQAENTPKKNLFELAGKLSHKTANKMLKYVSESREEWGKTD